MAVMSELVKYLTSNEDQFKSKSRLASLYSDFPVHRLTNPDGYMANIAAWKSALASASRVGILSNICRREVISSSEFIIPGPRYLERELELPDMGYPVALLAVYKEAVNQGEFYLLQDYLNANSSVLTGREYSMLGGVVQTTFSWALSFIGFGKKVVDTELISGEYVCIENLETIKSRLMARLMGKEAKKYVFTVSKFGRLLSALTQTCEPYSILSVHLLILYLTRDVQPQVAVYCEKTKIIKFLLPGESREISEVDKAQATLDDSIFNMEETISRMNEKVESLDQELRKALRLGNKSLALRSLREKKFHESNINKQHDLLHELQTLQLKVEEAESRVEVVRVMENSAKALQALNEQIGGIEGVEDKLDNLYSEVSLGSEIQETITNIINLDEMDIEDEVSKLEMELSKTSVNPQHYSMKPKGEINCENSDEELLRRLKALKNPLPIETGIEYKKGDGDNNENFTSLNDSLHQEKEILIREAN